ncbi:UPF0389 protein CG9231 [Bacillus rossius redtenbacheri]|uniref:UPF0389 protein CG9231 n=1 Tax=Bacillus rossius redtenbacheri TaxID=93214 RepID=UPI002FDDB757
MALMLRTFLARRLMTPLPEKFVRARNICKTSARLEKPSVAVKEAEMAGGDPTKLGPLMIKVKPYMKYCLVWTGKYKSVSEVPEKLSHSVLDMALNKMRVKISIYMMGATVLGCFAFVFAGKRMAKEGDSLAKRTIDHHAQLREEARREREAAPAK